MSDSPNDFGTNFITFYSFKGGVGRSMALINVAGIMAGRGFRVLALDMDLEAPGISYLMRHEGEADREGEVLPGFVDLMSDACERGTEADLFSLSPQEVIEKYSYPYQLPKGIEKSDEGYLRIMPAGSFDGDYPSRLDKLALGQLYLNGQGMPLIQAFKQVITDADQFDFIFIDSRTGFSDESGICTRDLGDYLVVVMGLNRQNEEGTAEFLRSLRDSGVQPKGLQVVLSPVPNGEDDLLERREKKIQTHLTKVYGENISLNLQIPYHPRLALTEEPHVFRRTRGYLYEAYVQIEEAVRRMMGISADSFAQRVLKAVEKKDFDLVLRNLQQLTKVDEGGRQLLSLIIGPLTPLLRVPKGEGLRGFLLNATLPAVPWLFAKLADDLHEAKDINAEKFYKSALELAPDDANNHGNYANFLTNIRQDPEGAEKHYQRALELAPDDANFHGNYALFLTDIRKEHEEAEKHYQRALELEPDDADFHGNYANFLTDIRKEHEEAEKHYQRALELAPGHANFHGNYASFLKNIRKEHEEAEKHYLRALELAPDDANSHGNYANFLVLNDRSKEAQEMLERAFELSPDEQSLLCELLFYACAHFPEDYPKSLAELKGLLEAGETSEDWPLEENVRVAREAGHPHSDFIEALAAVVSGKAEVATLEAFPVWQKANFEG